MDAEPQAAAPSDSSRGNFLLFAAAGIGIYVVLRILDPAIGYPLRHISSAVATVLLNALSIPSTREGTTISTSDFSFDVNPDCSGSTSLRIMLTLGALWFGMYPNLTFGRRLICLALAAPIAVFCNALRVTTLVALGDSRGEPVEGLPHELIGILAFALAMAMVYVMTLIMAKEPTVRERSGPRAHLLFLALPCLIAYAPVIWGVYLLVPTNAPSIILGLAHAAFVLIGGGLMAFAAWSRPERRVVPAWIPCAIFAGAVTLSITAAMTDVITIASVSFLAALFALAIFFRGWEFAFKTLPLQAIIFLGLPGMHLFKMESFASRFLPGAGPYNAALLLQTLMVAVFIGIFLFAWRRRKPRREKQAAPAGGYLVSVPMKFLILVSFLGVLFQSVFNSRAARFDQLNRIEVPLVLGDWTGADLEVSAREIELIGRERLMSRLYTNEQEESVHLLLSATGADRSRAHKPEFCMTARGWEEQDREVLQFEAAEGKIPMTKLLLERDGKRMEMRYWFDDGEGTIYGTFAELYPADVARRAVGKRTDWHVYRVFGVPGAPSSEEFIRELTR